MAVAGGGAKFRGKHLRFSFDGSCRGETFQLCAFRLMAVAGGRKFRDELQRFSLVAVGAGSLEMSFCAFRLMAVAEGRKFSDERGRKPKV